MSNWKNTETIAEMLVRVGKWRNTERAACAILAGCWLRADKNGRHVIEHAQGHISKLHSNTRAVQTL